MAGPASSRLSATPSSLTTVTIAAMLPDMAWKSGKSGAAVASATVVVLLSGCINFESGFTAPASADPTARSFDVALADVTGDGLADPLVTTSEGQVRRLAACGDGCFELAEAVGSGVRSMAVDDLDGDGVQDVVVGTTTGVVAYFGGSASGGRPAGLVESDQVTVDPTTLDANVVTGDFDGDGAVDVAHFGTLDDPDFPAPRYVEVMGDGTGGFAAPTERFQSLSPSVGMGLHDVGDFDGDGDDEVFFIVNSVWGGTSGSVTVYGDDADDRFNIALPDLAAGVASGDLDGDGRDDLVVQRFSLDDFPEFPTLYWTLRSTGVGATGFGPGGAVTTLETAPGTTSALDLEVADLDGDGHADVVASDPERDRISWWHGEGDGSFTTYGASPRVDRAAGQGASEIAVEHGVTRPDLLVTNRTASSARVTFLPNASAGS